MLGLTKKGCVRPMNVGRGDLAAKDLRETELIGCWGVNGTA